MQNKLINFWYYNRETILAGGKRLLITAIIIATGIFLIKISRRLINRAVTGKLHADETFASILRMAIRYGIILICLIMILEIFGISTTGLIAILGAAGVAVGFALKDTLSNIAAGIVILFLRPFKKGDFIECSGIMGSVQELGLFAATLQTPDGIFISAPNSSLWGTPIKNYSRNPYRRLDITITISYTDSVDTAFIVLRDIITKEARFLKDPPPQVMVQSLGELGIGITLRAWVNGSEYWNVYWDQMKLVKEKIQEAGLTIALPRREVNIKNEQHQIDKKQFEGINTL